MPLSLEEKARLLSMVDVFELLSREELEELAHRASDARLMQGEDRRRAPTVSVTRAPRFCSLIVSTPSSFEGSLGTPQP